MYEALMPIEIINSTMNREINQIAEDNDIERGKFFTVR